MRIFGMNVSFGKEKVEAEAETKTKASDGSTLITVGDLANLGQGKESLALKVEAVFSCLRDKSETIGQLPLRFYKNMGENKRQEIKSGRNHRIFTQNPNDYQTMQQFMEMLVVSVERFGAFYAYKEKNDRGVISGLIPFKYQNQVVPNMDLNGNVFYTYTKNDGTIGDAYDLDSLFIVKGFTLDGFTPVSPMQQTATNLSIASSQEASYREVQTSGITAQMALSTDAVFDDDNARERLKEDLKKIRGPNGVSEIAIFEQGLKPISLKLTPAELELLNSRQFTVNRICRTFRVPLHRVGVINTAGKDNIVDLDEAYMRDSLNPILVKAEKALNEMLPEGFTVQFNRNSFYSGSPWRLMEHVEKGVKGGLLAVNEGREIIGQEDVEGGDVFAIDNNNVVYGNWSELEAMQDRLYPTGNENNKPSGENENE